MAEEVLEDNGELAFSYQEELLVRFGFVSFVAKRVMFNYILILLFLSCREKFILVKNEVFRRED